jgi:hypothetical protein
MKETILHRTPISRLKCLGYGVFSILVGIVAPLIVLSNRWPGEALHFREAATLYACPAMFIPLAYLYLRKLFDPLSGLIITPEGIINNSGLFGSKYAKFSEISSIKVKHAAGSNSGTFIYLYTDQPAGFSNESAPGFIRFFQSKEKQAKGVRLIAIIGTTLQGPIEKTIEALRQHAPCPVVDER